MEIFFVIFGGGFSKTSLSLSKIAAICGKQKREKSSGGKSSRRMGEMVVVEEVNCRL